MFIVRHKKLFFALSALLVLAAIAATALIGIRPSIEFTGGSVVEVTYADERPEKAALEAQLSELGIGGVTLRPSGEAGYLLRSSDLSTDEHKRVISTLSQGGTLEMREERFSTVGPTIGSELRTKAFIAIGVVVLAIVLFIAFAFRHVSEPVSSWKYGLIAIVALLHDVLVPLGVFAILGAILGFEVDVLFVVALLTILGYSVNDTIVVFDRIRENLRQNKEDNVRERFEETVGKSLTQTIPRSINTSLTTLLVLVALYFVGAEATQHFALTLIVGVIAGAYSSIFLASPLLIAWETKRKESKEA